MTVQLRAIHERCSGCGVCRLACALENFKEVNPAKALLKIKGRFPEPGDYWVHICDQCGACAEACPVEAIQLEDGVYRIDEEACTACLECVDACPHEVMMVHPDADEPCKCILCGVCAHMCPREALVLIEDQQQKAV